LHANAQQFFQHFPISITQGNVKIFELGDTSRFFEEILNGGFCLGMRKCGLQDFIRLVIQGLAILVSNLS
jgi:hypothetical protein